MVKPHHPRPPRLPIRLSAEIRASGELITGVTRNLSIGGVCLETHRPLEEGAALALTLFLVEDEIEVEGGRGLDLRVRVQWTADAERGYAAGVKFIDLTPAQQAALAKALQVIGEA